MTPPVSETVACGVCLGPTADDELCLAEGDDGHYCILKEGHSGSHRYPLDEIKLRISTTIPPQS